MAFPGVRIKRSASPLTFGHNGVFSVVETKFSRENFKRMAAKWWTLSVFNSFRMPCLANIFSSLGMTYLFSFVETPRKFIWHWV